MGSLLETQEPVDLGRSCGHEGLDKEGLESNEVGDNVEHQLGSKYLSELPSGLAVVVLPELGILEILVASRTDLHTEFESFLQLNLLDHVSVLRVPVLHLGNEVDIHLSEEVSLQERYLSFAFVIDELQGPVDQVS